MKSFQIFTTVFLILVLFPNGINYTFATAQSEKQLLLQLKNSLTYDSSLSTKLATWHESTDHCQWIGVQCDNQSRVSVLDLSNESISGGINNNSTSNLFMLVHLQTLNLAQNTFDSIELPLGFGKLAELRYLNLSNSGFSGQIPLDFSNLTRLVTLDLSSAFYSSLKLENPNLEKLIHNYTNLRELHLDGVNISAKGYNWCNAVSSYTPNLRVLSLSNTYLTGPFDSSLRKLRYLSVIRLDGNTFSSNCRIQMLDLSSNSLHGRIPSYLTESTFMTALNLSRNKLGGRIPDSIGKMQQLESLDLSFNDLGGEIPKQIVELRFLSFLNVLYNYLVGKIPQGGTIQTFPASSFVGNKGLCGFPLVNKSCSDPLFSHIRGRAGKFRY